MMRTLLVLLVALTASAASGADPATSQSMSGSPKPPPAPKKSAQPPKLTPAEERLVAVSNTKAQFMAAMGSCARPDDCDPNSPRKNMELVTMLKGAEDAFMEACAQCASDADCEEERQKIRSGRGRYGYNVCYVKSKGAKPADKKATDKKAPDAKGAKPASPSPAAPSK